MNTTQVPGTRPPRHGRKTLTRAQRYFLGYTLVTILAVLLGVTLSAHTAVRTVPGPAVTMLETAPAVTVTQTVTASPAVSAGQVLLKRSGSGNWSSPPFQVGASSPQLTVTYVFSGNYLGGQPDNFAASIKSSGDSQLAVNTIAGSGGMTTTVYPDVSSGDTAYHLEIMASGSWSFTITETG